MKKFRILMTTLLLVLSLLMMAGCSDGGSSNIALADDATLEIVGAGLDIKFTPEDLAAMPTKTIVTENLSSKGDVTETEIVAISLKELLSEHDVNLSDMTTIELAANDGYVMSATQKEYGDSDVYIIMEEDGEALEYPRSAIPKQRAMYWVKYLCKITIDGEGASSAESESTAVNTISIFEPTAANAEINTESVSDGDKEYDAYSTKAYYETIFEEDLPSENLRLIAEDGLSRSESAKIFFESYVSFDEDIDNTPLYYGPKMKPGMKLKEIKYSISGDKAVYYGEEIELSELFKDLNMEEADMYLFTAADGFSAEVPKEAIAEGSIESEDGVFTTDFDDYDMSGVKGKGKIKNISTITVIK